MNPHINGLSDHEAQIITVENMVPIKKKSPQRGTLMDKVYWNYNYF